LQKVTKADISHEGFPYMTMKNMAVGQVPAMAFRVTYVGELGWEFYCPIEYGLKLYDTLLEAGQSEGIVPAGYRAIDSLRLEKGYRYWGGDISPDYSPFESGLGFAVALDKGDFIGREALLKQKAEGVKQKLCCLTLADPTAIAIGKEPIRAGDRVAGWVTSGGYGYTVGKSIVYGYLPIECAAPGTELDVEILGERVKAVVEREPLYDPKGVRVKA
jgi:4-methylaminobutanoate oxidase (formaldehyde-forming)